MPELLTIDKTTGTVTSAKLTGTPVSTSGAPTIESLEFDPTSGEAWLLGAGPGLWEIDPTTGAGAQVMGVQYRTVWAMTSVPEPRLELLQRVALATILLGARSRQRKDRALGRTLGARGAKTPR